MHIYASMSAEQKVSALEDIYQNYDIYRCVIVYDDPDEFEQIMIQLLEKEYPVTKGADASEDDRIFALRVGEDPFYMNIPWEQVNMLISLSPDCDAYVSELFYTECVDAKKINLLYI